jgi:membrane fusion protein (multidrug efflux system)
MSKTIQLSLISLILSLTPTISHAQKAGFKGPTPVITSPVVVKLFVDTVEALGTTRSNEMVIVTADTAEKVTRIYFEEGQEVKKGDLLITLAKGEENAALKSAQAELSEAQSSYNRAKGLQETKAISKAALQERLSALNQSRAAISGVTARLDKLAITAPFDGVIGLREVSVGTLVRPADVITRIDDISVIKVDFDVPSLFLPTLKKGLKIIGKVEAFGDREFIGEVQTVDTQVDPLTRTIKVRAVIPNEDRALKPGLLMVIDLIRNERQAIVIPEEALIKRGNRNFVFISQNKDGKTIAIEKEIELGARRRGEIEVISGLGQDDHVINHGTLKVKNGSEINIKAIETTKEVIGEMLKSQTNNPNKSEPQ